VGLVLFGAKARGGGHYGLVTQPASVGIQGVLDRMKGWFQGNF
jgi:hypothetical protein